MTRFPFHFWGVPLFGAALLLTSCESTDQKRVAVAPPPKAQAPTITESVVPQQASKAEEKKAVSLDPIELTIAAAEREYKAGQANYLAGHLEAAKDSFDRAFDTLLQGPGDIRKDDRLQREFDKIVEGVNQLELQALKEGDGFTEQRAEPAPIDEANEVTFPVDPNIKARAEAELKTTQSDLPLVLNDTVAAYINYFSSRGRSSLEYGYVRSGRYRDMILRTFKEEGIPQDLIYLAQAESGFRPVALSRVGARGMWQFMAGSGASYGLKRTWWADDRQDPIKATRAAARFLKDLYKQFGDWYLVMAAYNSGAGTVQRAVQRTGYADFWELHRRGVLPAETRNYVPIILAITIISKNPTQYGLDRLRPDPPLSSETVNINYPVDLRLVAECVDSSVGVLQELNPSLLRLTTPKDQQFDLHLPAGTSEKYHTAIAAIPEDMRVWWQYHRVRSGDTLGSIAKKYRTTAEAIQKVNGLDGDDLRLESKLIIPITPGRQSSGEAVSYAKRATRYKVRKGDTVLSVADEFNVPAASVRKWNRLKGNALKAGRTLTIYRAVKEASSEPQESASRSGKKVLEDEEQTVSAKTSRGRVKRTASRSRKAEADEEASVSSKRSSGTKAAKRGSTSAKESASTRTKKRGGEADKAPASRKRATKGKGTSPVKKTARSSSARRSTKTSKHAAR